MELLEGIKSRRSIRAFHSKQVDDGQVATLLDAARLAPSAGNIQPWEFIVVRTSHIKQQLAVAALNQTFIHQASVVIVVCANSALSRRRYGDRGAYLYSLQDTAAAAENLLLAAHGLGLGACWVGAFQETPVRAILELPPQIKPVAIIPIGYPAEKPYSRRLTPFHEVVHYETY